MGRPRLDAPTERACKRCLITKPIDDFPLQNTTRKGMTWRSYRHTCKRCESKRTDARRRLYVENGLCHCGRPRCVESNSYCAVCRAARLKWASENLEQKRAQSIEYRAATKRAAFAAYGNKGACCGESNFEFLEIDHIGGWGKNHRNVQGQKIGGNALYRWLRNHNYPQDGFRILCGSCHGAISYYGYCPHQHMQKVLTGESPVLESIPVPMAE